MHYVAAFWKIHGISFLLHYIFDDYMTDMVYWLWSLEMHHKNHIKTVFNANDIYQQFFFIKMVLSIKPKKNQKSNMITPQK